MASNTENRGVNIYINGKAADDTIKQLRASSRALYNELALLPRGSDEFKQRAEQLKSVNTRLQAIRADAEGVGGAFGFLRSEIGQVATAAAGLLTINKGISVIKDVISQNAKLSDSYADIMRVTGMTEVEVQGLYISLSKLDTRTGLDKLTDIAVIAGKLGVAKNDILDFTKATDMLVVALGDELGNADQITTQLGKILNVFDGKVTGDNITRLGNAMVKLANDGVASAGFIADFTQRVSGIAKSANLSLGATVGLGAGLEELGARSESSATAIQSLILKIGQNLPAAAKIAGMASDDFAKLFGDKPEEALLRYAEGLTKNKTAFAEIATSFKDAGEDGARVIETITKLGEKSDFLRGKFETGAKSLEEYGEIEAAFALKNETLGAKLEKMGKAFTSLTVTGQPLNSLFGKLVDVATSVATWIGENTRLLFNMVKVLVIAGTAWATYNAYLWLANTALFKYIFLQQSSIAITTLHRTVILSLAAAKALLTGNIDRAAKAMRLLNITMSANPIGAVISLLAAAVVAFALFGGSLTTAQKQQQAFNDTILEAEKNTVRERLEIDRLTKLISDETVERQKKLDAIKRLREIMPAQLKGYSDEEILAGKATKAINEYTKALIQQAKAKVAADKIAQLAMENLTIDADIKSGKNGSGFFNNMMNQLRGGFTGKLGVQVYQEDLKQKKSDNISQQKVLEGFINDTGVTSQAVSPIGGGGTSGTKDAIVSIDALEQKLKELKAERDKADVGSPMFKSLSEQITAIEAQLTNLHNKKTAIQKQEDSDDAKSAAEYKRLSEDQSKLDAQRIIDSQSKNEKEVAQESLKYDQMIQKWTDYQKMKGTSAAEAADAQDKIDWLEVDKKAAITAVLERQEKEYHDNIQQLRDSLAAKHESELDKEKVRINQFYDDLLRDNTGNEKAMADIQQQRTTELNASELREKDRLETEKTKLEQEGAAFGQTDREKRLIDINQKYDAEIEALRQKFSDELQLTQEFQDALDQIEANRQAALAEDENERKKKLKDAAIQAAEEVANAVFQISANNRQAESDAKLDAIETARNKELDNENLTEAQKKKINDKYDKLEKAEKLRAWKADQKAAIAQAAINTALSVAKTFAQFGWPAGIVPAAFATAAGIAQTVVIASQKAPKFAEGGYSNPAMENKTPSGWVRKPTLFAKSASGRPFIAGEGYKSEYIISSRQLQNPDIADFVSMMEAGRQTGRFADGGYSNPVVKVTAPGTDLVRLEGLMAQMISAQLAANDKQVILSNRVLEDFQAKNVKIKQAANA